MYNQPHFTGNNQLRVSLGMTPHIHGGEWVHEDGVFCGPRHGDVLETGWGCLMVYIDPVIASINTPEHNSESHHEQPESTEE